MQSIETGHLLERIQIGILGPLPETNLGNKHVAVATDAHTKWPEAYALPNQEADTAAQTVMDNSACRFGRPLGALSDQGRNFESRPFRGLCDSIESVKQRTTPYHPQRNGGAEWLIRTVTSVVSKIAEEQEEWDRHLPKVLSASRGSTHETTGFSPSMLMFGREMGLPIDIMRDAPPSEESPDNPPFVKVQREILKGVQDRVEKNLEASLGHQKDVYDARCKRKSRPYKVGDLAWLEEKAVPRWVHRKSYRPWSGPWRVVKVISDVTYRIQSEEVAPLRARRKTRLIVHFNRLKPHRSRPVQLQPSLHDVEEDRNLPTDPNVGEYAVTRSPLTTDPAPMENAADISDEPDARVQRSARNRYSLAWMRDFLSGKDFDNALPLLWGGGGV